MGQGQKGLWLLKMREMTRRGNSFKPRPFDQSRQALAIGGRGYAIILTPDDQSGRLNAIEPLAQFGIVQIGLPAKAGKAFNIARDNRQLIIAHIGKITLGFVQIMPFECSNLGGMQGPYILKIAIRDAACLNPIGIDEQEFGKDLMRFGRHLKGNPATQRKANHWQILDRQMIKQIEIEIGNVIW